MDAVEPVAVDQLHHDVGLAVLFAVAVDLDDVRMVDRRQRARLLQKLVHERPVLPDALLHHLERDRAAERLVVRLVHRAHAALAQLVDQQEVREPRRHLELRAAGGAPYRRKRVAVRDVQLLAAVGARDGVEPFEKDVGGQRTHTKSSVRCIRCGPLRAGAAASAPCARACGSRPRRRPPTAARRSPPPSAPSRGSPAGSSRTPP